MILLPHSHPYVSYQNTLYYNIIEDIAKKRRGGGGKGKKKTQKIFLRKKIFGKKKRPKFLLYANGTAHPHPGDRSCT